MSGVAIVFPLFRIVVVYKSSVAPVPEITEFWLPKKVIVTRPVEAEVYISNIPLSVILPV